MMLCQLMSTISSLLISLKYRVFMIITMGSNIFDDQIAAGIFSTFKMF